MTPDLEKDIIQWDIQNWSKALKFWEETVDWSKIETCLELGGREGGLSLWLALKGKTVLCSDYENTKNIAEKLHHKYNNGLNISYQDIDATNIPYENKFDLIIFKSIIGGIGRNNNKENQQIVFNQIYKALKPGGILLFAENLEASSFHQFFRKNFNKWSKTWRYISLNECSEFLSKFTKVKLKTTGILGTFGRTEKQKYILSQLDSKMLCKITPQKWHYIVYVIAEK